MKKASPEQYFLYHISHPETLKTAQEDGEFREASLETEGFIHCSFQNQMIKTANRFYRGQNGLLILKIDPEMLKSEVRLEPAENGELFPHIYGRINLDAITGVLPFNPDLDGQFITLPSGVD
ncbi:MAG: DUF952 domain-containing protein [Anaerolineaceae bacterium]